MKCLESDQQQLINDPAFHTSASYGEPVFYVPASVSVTK